MTDYEYDVFISYKRQAVWTGWVRDKFCEQLAAYLQQDLGRPPRIFIDEQMSAGRDLPQDLGHNLAHSKVAILLLSGDYFQSEWCIHELDVIIDRDTEFCASTDGTQHIIIPVIVHDGESIPERLKKIIFSDFSNFRRTVIAKDSQLAEDFSGALKLLSPAVRAAIAAAPAFNPKWIDHHKTRFTAAQRLGPGQLPPVNFPPIPSPDRGMPPRPKL